MRDTESAGVGAITIGGAVAAAVEETGAAVGAGVAVADCVVDANDDAPASTTRLKSRLLSRTGGSAAAALTTAGFALAVAGAEPDPGRDSPRWRGSVPDVSGVARVPARPVEEVEVDGVRAAVVDAAPDEPVVVLVCGSPELLIAVLRGRLGASFVADNPLFADGVSDDVEPEFPDELDGDESPDDEPLPESPGAANATAGGLATAIPTPIATARADMQPMCFAFSMGFPFAHPRRINGAVVINKGVEQSLHGSRLAASEGSNFSAIAHTQRVCLQVKPSHAFDAKWRADGAGKALAAVPRIESNAGLA